MMFQQPGGPPLSRTTRPSSSGAESGTVVLEAKQQHPLVAPNVHVLDVHQLAPSHDGDAVGDLLNLGQHVAGEDDCLARGPGLMKPPLSEHRRAGGIESGRRLVEHHHFDRIGKCLSHRELCFMPVEYVRTLRLRSSFITRSAMATAVGPDALPQPAKVLQQPEPGEMAREPRAHLANT